MQLKDIGFNSKLEKFSAANNLPESQIGRVIAEHKERYIVKTTTGEFESEITGNMRFSAKSREDFPAVGDWVTLTIYDGAFAVIHTIFPRFSIIKRQAPGQSGEVQIIATNIDHAFLVQAADRDFNINRLERYLTICYSSGVSPVIVLTKTDLTGKEHLAELIAGIRSRIMDVPVVAVSSVTRAGYDQIQAFIESGRTYCLLGSSGVGKSTLLNILAGSPIMKTDAISQSTSKGRHTTSHRELIILESGGILVDNPGMREVGIADTDGGLETTFDTIVRLAKHCRFTDCSHTQETGCAVLEAIGKGEIDRSSYDNYLRMEKERNYFESTIAERRKKDRAFGKMVKNHKKGLNKDGY